MCAAVLATTLLSACVTPELLEPFEPQLIFRPRPADEQQIKLLAATSRIEEVRLTTPDGLTLHGWLKHPERWTPGTAHPLVIVYGGVGQEVSEIVTHAHAAGWGWLMINYRGFGLSEGSPSERKVLSDA